MKNPSQTTIQRNALGVFLLLGLFLLLVVLVTWAAQSVMQQGF